MAGDPKNPDAAPSPGDLSLCISCASVLVFDDTLRVRAPRSGEVETAFRARPALRTLVERGQRAIRSIDRRTMRNA